MAVAGAAALLALGLALWSYRRERRRGVLALLCLTRTLALAGLLGLLLQPAVQLQSVTRLPNHVAVLVDSSASMGITEPSGGRRLDLAEAMIKRSSATLDQWRKRRIVDLYRFGASLRGMDPAKAARTPLDPVTQIMAALTELKKRTPRKDLAGVVLVSDGADNGRLAGGTLTAAARTFFSELGAPVHTALAGGGAIKDLAVAELHVDHFAFVRNAVRVEADLLALGVDQPTVTVTLQAAGAVVAQTTVALRPGKTRYRARLEFVPQRVGKFVYTVSLPQLDGEALTSNNQRSFVLKVIRDRIRVLQLCGRPSWDERFMRRLLKRDPNVDLISFFILRTPGDLTSVDSRELSLIPFPTDELFSQELGSFDLVVLQNFNYGPEGIGSYLPQIRAYVDNGGALAMVGGDRSFTSGSYHGTVLAPVLPVRLLRPRADPRRLISVERFKPRVTRQGRDHPILQLAPSREESATLLAGLPPLEGVNLVAGAAPGATVLLTHPSLRARGGKPMPVLATTEAGKGRTLALTTDTSWHWAFLSAGRGGTRQAYDRFWRNAIRWLIRDPELKYLRVIAQTDRVPVGATIKAVVRAYKPDYSPAVGVEVDHEVINLGGGAGGSAGRGKTDDRGELTLEFMPRATGAYRLRAQATLAGRKTAEDAVVLVEPAGPELRQPAARPGLLTAIAAASGGRYLGPTRQLPAELKLLDPRVLQVNWRKDINLWSSWWALLLVVALLGGDWALRRKFGYL